MISHQHRCIFVHIPKTAGNSVNRVFGIGWEDHKDLRRFAAELEPVVFRSYFKFAIVRNPWDRILSDYNYQLKKSRERDSKLGLFRSDGSPRDFAEWVEAVLAAPHSFEPQRWGGAVSPHIHRWSPQLDWIEMDDQVGVDFVARLENLPEDFGRVCEKVGLPAVHLPHRNRKRHGDYSSYFDRRTRDLIGDFYARDIAAFGYEFERATPSVWIEFPRCPRFSALRHFAFQRRNTFASLAAALILMFVTFALVDLPSAETDDSPASEFDSTPEASPALVAPHYARASSSYFGWNSPFWRRRHRPS